MERMNLITRLFAVAVVARFVGCHPLPAATITLRWNPNPEPDISHYLLRYRTADSPAVEINTGNVTRYLLNGAVEGLTYIFDLRAVNTAGGVSDPSVDLIHTVAVRPVLDRSQWVVHSFSSEETAREPTAAANAFDGNAATFWHSVWEQQPPHYIAFRLPRAALVTGIRYLPRQDGDPNGRFLSWELQSSSDGVVWENWATGEWPDTAAEKQSDLPLRTVTYFRLWNGERFASAAEIWLLGTYVPDSVSLTMQSSIDMREWKTLHTMEVPKLNKEFFRIKVETK